jgi:predicted Zn finger-like uncharacterized protein
MALYRRSVDEQSDRKQIGGRPVVTTRRSDIVVPWEIVDDEVPSKKVASPSAVLTGAAPIDHCPACSSRLVERSSDGADGTDVRCLSCARVWRVGRDGISLRTRIIVDP